jgi:hypothetical protein
VLITTVNKTPKEKKTVYADLLNLVRKDGGNSSASELPFNVHTGTVSNDIVTALLMTPKERLAKAKEGGESLMMFY